LIFKHQYPVTKQKKKSHHKKQEKAAVNDFDVKKKDDEIKSDSPYASGIATLNLNEEAVDDQRQETMVL
jgi:hypothetical protein